MNGILNINKPEGPTSFSIVSFVKKITGVKRVGHAGTLDPAASGVLPVCLGQGTRTVEFLMDATKDYRAEIELGKTTDTFDAAGIVTAEGDFSGIDRDRIETVIPSFLGEIQQVPPAYSALKHHGKPYYELARAGIDVEMESRPVFIHSIDILDWKPPLLTLDITCGKGTYIRSLANDLGRILGCGAYMKSLVRRRYGPFSINDAISPDELKQAFAGNYWHNYIHPVDSVLKHLQAFIVNENIGEKLRHGHSFGRESIVSETGREISLPTGKHVETLCRVYSTEGLFLGIFRFIKETEEYKPVKIFN